MSDEQKQTSSPSSPDSRSGSGSPDVLDGGSVRALTAALEGSNKKHDAHIVAIASLTKAVMENTAATSNNGKAIDGNSKSIDKLGEYITDFTGQAPDVIMAGKLTIDAASRSNEELAKTAKRMEDASKSIIVQRTVGKVTVAPDWSHRALDTLWPYAEHSAQRMIVLSAASFGAGGSVIWAIKTFVAWVL